MINRKNQNGVTIIAAIFIIVVLGFMGVMFLTMVNTGSLTAVNDLQSAQALYVAEGGLESAVTSLNTSTLGNRIACGNVTGNANLTIEPLGQGQFTVTGASVYSAAATTLNGAITNAATTINVKSTTGYAASGRIMIDRELIDYSGITPGTSTAFTNAVRGRDGTIASAHANGTSVGQDQCTITSTGGVPTIAAPAAQRQVTEGIQLQEGWVVGAPGAVAAQRPLFLRFPQTTWNIYDSTALNINAQLNSISMLSYADGWAVGVSTNPGTNKATALRWNGASWTNMAASLPATATQNLLSISMVSSTDGFAVGNNLAAVCGVAAGQPEILRWNGVAWNCVVPPTVPTLTGNYVTDLTAVVMLDTNNDGIADDGWAFGNNQYSTQLRWNIPCLGGAATGTWTDCSAYNWVTQGFNAVSMVTSTYGWAVGDLGTNVAGACNYVGGVGWPALSYLNNTTGNWVCPAAGTWPATRVNLNGVFMISFTDGWAVGASNGTRPAVFRWDTPCGGGALTGVWNDCTNATYVPAINQALNSVYCVDANDCWAVGNAGLILHWNGLTWSQVQAGLTALNLQEVYIIGPEQRPQAAWQEVVK
jgi:Tfp pilus assembly protein PilX